MSTAEKYKVLSPLRRNGERFGPGGKPTIELTKEEAEKLGPGVVVLFDPSQDLGTVAAGAEDLAKQLAHAKRVIEELIAKLDAADEENKEQGKTIAELISQRDELIKKLDAAEKKSAKK